MKKIITLSVTALAIAASFFSCKKEKDQPVKTVDGRSVKFKLYTSKDFSDDEHKITFSIFIKNSDYHLFDSVYAPMKVKDIPKMANAIVAEKRIHNYAGQLIVGFVYEIEGIGISWHIDTLSAGSQSKLVDYAFE